MNRGVSTKGTRANPPRVIMRIEITHEAKGKLEVFSDNLGMTQISVSSRLMSWFALQTRATQLAVLDVYPTDMTADIARLMLATAQARQGV